MPASIVQILPFVFLAVVIALAVTLVKFVAEWKRATERAADGVWELVEILREREE